jgi:23S rRNA (uridine2552-2'-O)-methyltransferase
MGKKREYERKDSFYFKAKSEGYQSRASYKLLEIHQKYNILRPGAKVLDLGAWPGGWMQIASEQVGPAGFVVGIDLVQIDLNIPNCKAITGDVGDPEIVAQAMAAAGRKFDVVLSDMSPKLTGIKEADRAALEECAELAWGVAQQGLIQTGAMVVKVFKSNEAEVFYRKIKDAFKITYRVELDSTRKSSNEFYLIALGFLG